MNQRNLGIAGNWMSAIECFDSKYVITIGGDDFLIDPGFLQYNFQIMEADSSLSLNICDGYFFNDGETSKSEIKFPSKFPFRADIYQWIELHSPMFNAQSLFFRRSALPSKFEQWMLTSEQEDWLLMFLALQSGALNCSPRKSTMYRVHQQSYTKRTKPIRKILGSIKLMQNIHKHTNQKYKAFYGNDVWKYEMLSYAYYLNGDKSLAFKAMLKALSIQPRYVFVKTWFKMLFFGYKPYVW